jgi:drug/metabolite transporter (DMT)-like permease
VGYGIGSVLQSVGARRTADATDLGGLGRIVGQLPYLLGLGLDGVAFLANVVALQRLPLFLVQSVLVGSVGVTAILAAVRGQRLGRRDWASLGALGAGLVLLCVTADPRPAAPLAPPGEWVLLAATVVPVTVGLVGLRLRGRVAAAVLAGGAGLAWTGVALASRAFSAEPLGWSVLAHPLVWTVVVQGVLGMVLFALALQRGDVTTVTAVTFMLELLVPSLLGLWLFGDGVLPGQAPLAVLGFVLAVGGTVALVRFAE